MQSSVSKFFNILGCIAGPMIFLSVAWGIYGIGDAATFGRIGKKMILRYMGTVFLVSICGVLTYPFLGPAISAGSEGETQLSSVAELILGIFPSTIIEPFASGNTLQIIFMAVVIGIALLYLGRQTRSVTRAIEEVNILVQFLMELVSKLVPFVIFLVIINLIWSGNLVLFTSLWKLGLALLIVFTLTGSLFILYTSVRMKVSPVLLFKKNLHTFIVALSTASSAAAFDSNVQTCEKNSVLILL